MLPIKGDQVIAVESIKDGVARIYGEGEYIGDKQVPAGTLKGINNPCIRLKDGKYAWGYMCWWGHTDAFHKKFPDIEIEVVPIPEDHDLEPEENEKYS